MKVEKREFTFNTGQQAWIEYDQAGDLLEIFFQAGEANCAIELTESIILRFDWKTAQPFSLGFISASHLIQATEYGEMHFQLLVDEWPDELRDKVWQMLRSAPLNELLQISSYAPAHTHQVIPMAAIKHLDWVAEPV